MKIMPLRTLMILSFAAFFLVLPGLQARESSLGKRNRSHKDYAERSQERKQKFIDDLSQELNLSDEQKQALETRFQENRLQMNSLFKEMKAAKEDLKITLDKEGDNTKEVKAATAKLKETQSKMIDARVEGITNLKSILTAEQFKELRDLKERQLKEKGQNRKSGKFPKRKHTAPQDDSR
jgi:Spy/CpxP family protein refolding chaperone